MPSTASIFSICNDSKISEVYKLRPDIKESIENFNIPFRIRAVVFSVFIIIMFAMRICKSNRTMQYMVLEIYFLTF